MPDLPLEISCREVQSLRDADADLLLLDCRETQEHATAAIAGSVLLPMSEIQSRVDDLQQHRDRHVVVYCHHGMRSAQVTAWLRESQEFGKVQSMAGGIDQWSQQIDPAVPRY